MGVLVRDGVVWIGKVIRGEETGWSEMPASGSQEILSVSAFRGYGRS